MIAINTRDPRPIYMQIKEGLCRLIHSGALATHERLPSVRELAGQLAINPNTIQRAYRELEAAGWVATVQGKGCFVCAAPSLGNGELLNTFDRAARALLDNGVTVEELISRLQKGGNSHA